MTSLSEYLQLLKEPIPARSFEVQTRRQPSISVWKPSTCKSSAALVAAGTFGSGWRGYWSRDVRKSKGKIKTSPAEEGRCGCSARLPWGSLHFALCCGGEHGNCHANAPRSPLCAFHIEIWKDPSWRDGCRRKAGRVGKGQVILEASWLSSLRHV